MKRTAGGGKPGEGGVADDRGADAMDAPADRFCDIVMEGGITSGIIYASAVVDLARHYRFKNIGGSSIGAFAAALTAAAEYRRRHGAAGGFEALAGLPGQLAEEEGGRTLLERLFVPHRRTRRLFNVFLATLDRGGPGRILLFGLAAALRQYVWHVAIASLILAAIILPGPLQATLQCRAVPGQPACSLALLSWSGAALLTLGAALAGGILVGIAWDLGHGVVRNDFGLCRGWDAHARTDAVDLAGFLHLAIQRVAGRDADDAPLTFRDLWDAPGSPAQVLGFDARDTAARSINLEVYASNLAHSRPYRFPLEETEDMGRLFFRVEELERFFPRGIVQYLAAFSRPYTGRSEADPAPGSVGAGYLELPVADLPIVVAVRLSMGFPLLISAVPLHAVDHRRQCMDRCWISDGGLCSNFPIHLFDSFLPMWPTFGISLESREKSDPRRVELPQFHTSGRADSWDLGPEHSFWKLRAFIVSLWKTTWRWNDSTMMRMPGVRDRVVRLYLAKDEGGVNIRMGAAKIRMLGTTYGEPAARAFVEKFRSAGRGGWEEHRWVRLNCLMISLRERIRNFGKAVELDRHTTPLRDQFQAARRRAPLLKPARRSRTWPSEQRLDEPQVGELEMLVLALCQLEKAFGDAGNHEPYRAIPRTSLRMRHPT